MIIIIKQKVFSSLEPITASPHLRMDVCCCPFGSVAQSPQSMGRDVSSNRDAKPGEISAPPAPGPRRTFFSPPTPHPSPAAVRVPAAAVHAQAGAQHARVFFYSSDESGSLPGSSQTLDLSLARTSRDVLIPSSPEVWR